MKRVKHKIIVWPLCLLLLVGFFQIGQADVLCIGEDGHIEIETNCLPCCNESENSCELDTQEDIHDEHDDCYNCSDLSIDSPFRTKRISSFTNLEKHDLSIPLLNSNIDFSYALCKVPSQVYENLLTFKIIPIQAFISTTVLRC